VAGRDYFTASLLLPGVLDREYMLQTTFCATPLFLSPAELRFETVARSAGAQHEAGI